MKIDKERLVTRAAEEFFMVPEQRTNEKLTRTELRWLHDRGYVVRKAFMSQGGAVFFVWSATEKLKR